MARERDPKEMTPAPASGPTPPERSAHPKPMKKARVGYPGEPKEEVEYPADAPDPRVAAREAFRMKRGIWHDPVEPEVEFEGER